LSTPTTGKVAEIMPWIYHSWVKPALFEWECTPDPASLYKVKLQNTCALLPQSPASQETAGDHRQWDVSPALVTLEADFGILCMVEAWGVAHLIFEDEFIPCILFLLILVSSVLGTPRLWTVTHVCALPEREVLLPRLWFFILTISVQAALLSHAPTTIPPTQCAFMMVSVSVLTSSIALGSNG
jgi:hypothetical protein